MARLAAWEFEDTAEFDGTRLFAEIPAEALSPVRNGTLELTFTPGRIARATIFAHGIPGRDPGAFALVLTNAGAISLSCTERDGTPLRLKTPDGFVGSGERAQITLSTGVGGRFVAVNTDRRLIYPEAPEAGIVLPLPLRADCSLTGVHSFTFGAASGGKAPFFKGLIHLATLSDSVDAPTVAPPIAKVHHVDFRKSRSVTPRRVRTALGPVIAPPRRAAKEPKASDMKIATSEGDVPIRRLEAGAEILTRAGGFRPVRWSGHIDLDWSVLRQRPDLKPVVIRKDALGPGLPEADVVLTPEQRLLIPGAALSDKGAAADGYLPARTIREGAGLPEIEAMGITYAAFFCDRTCVAQTNGLWVEMVNPFDEGLNRRQRAQRDMLTTLFPDLAKNAGALRG